MDRRDFGRALVMGAVGAGAAGLAATPLLAQGMRQPGMQPGTMAMGPAEQRHGMDTLAIGSVSLQSSQLARERTRRPLLRQFAEFEIEEATTVSQIINELSGMGPPPPSPADRAALDRLARARGPAFDRDYIAAQLDGHQRLLGVQERYLQQGRNLHHRHIALLARGRILEHIRELQLLRTSRA